MLAIRIFVASEKGEDCRNIICFSIVIIAKLMLSSLCTENLHLSCSLIMKPIIFSIISDSHRIRTTLLLPENIYQIFPFLWIIIWYAPKTYSLPDLIKKLDITGCGIWCKIAWKAASIGQFFKSWWSEGINWFWYEHLRLNILLIRYYLNISG